MSSGEPGEALPPAGWLLQESSLVTWHLELLLSAPGSELWPGSESEESDLQQGRDDKPGYSRVSGDWRASTLSE